MTEHPLGNRVVSQIGITVRDIEKAVERFSRILGMEKPNIIITDDYEKAHTTYRGEASFAKAKLAFFKLGQVELELIEPIGEPSAWKDSLDANGERFHHIAFWVPDTDAAVKHLQADGISVIQQGDFTGGMYTYMDSEAQLGMVLELLQKKDT
jgi:catechol 2,3-dioxygenase-like lactoylglutathione lyase family enzyme